MSELDAFEVKVRQNIKLLSSPDAKARRKAAAWLGEAGEPSAITRLKQVYEEDPDASVRQAAAYSLGMFKVLEREMNGPDGDRVMDILEDVQLRGKMGHRAPVRTGCLMRLIVALLVSLVIILAFNFVIWPQYQDQIRDTLGVEAPARGGDSDDRDVAAPATAETALGTLLANIRADATLLQNQYTNPSELNCDAVFANPTPYTTTDTALADLATRLNGQIVQLVTAKAPYIQACASSSPALTAEQAAGPQAALEAILTELTSIETDLSAARG
jgi:hypothetical protein